MSCAALTLALLLAGARDTPAPALVERWHAPLGPEQVYPFVLREGPGVTLAAGRFSGVLEPPGSAPQSASDQSDAFAVLFDASGKVLYARVWGGPHWQEVCLAEIAADGSAWLVLQQADSPDGGWCDVVEHVGRDGKTLQRFSARVAADPRAQGRYRHVGRLDTVVALHLLEGGELLLVGHGIDPQPPCTVAPSACASSYGHLHTMVVARFDAQGQRRGWFATSRDDGSSIMHAHSVYDPGRATLYVATSFGGNVAVGAHELGGRRKADGYPESDALFALDAAGKVAWVRMLDRPVYPGPMVLTLQRVLLCALGEVWGYAPDGRETFRSSTRCHRLAVQGGEPRVQFENPGLGEWVGALDDLTGEPRAARPLFPTRMGNPSCGTSAWWVGGLTSAGFLGATLCGDRRTVVQFDSRAAEARRDR